MIKQGKQSNLLPLLVDRSIDRAIEISETQALGISPGVFLMQEVSVQINNMRRKDLNTYEMVICLLILIVSDIGRHLSRSQGK